MLRGIKDILKSMGDALVFADAGELLTEDQKARVLAHQNGGYPIAPDAAPSRVVLAGDEEFSSEAVERAIALCHEENAMLDLLCISPEGETGTIPLANVLPRLGSETDLDFQVTRRQGDLLDMTDAYLRARRDTLLLLIAVSDRLRSRAERWRRTGQWFRCTQRPAVKLLDDLAHV